MKMEAFDRLYFYQNYRQRYTQGSFKLIGDCFICHFIAYPNIRSCRGKIVFDSSRQQEQIFVYTLVHVNCTIKRTCNISVYIGSVRQYQFDMSIKMRTV